MKSHTTEDEAYQFTLLTIIKCYPGVATTHNYEIVRCIILFIIIHFIRECLLSAI